MHAGYYSVEPGETLRQLVERAGGLTPNAYLYGSEFTRVSTRAVQQARIDEYVQNLSIAIQRNAAAVATSAGAMSQGQAAQFGSWTASRGFWQTFGKSAQLGELCCRSSPIVPA